MKTYGIQIKNASEGVGKVLTSDANGIGTWTTPSGSAAYAATFTPGTINVANTITHGLGTTDIDITLIDLTTGEMFLANKINNITTTTVDIYFAENPAGDVRVVVLSSNGTVSSGTGGGRVGLLRYTKSYTDWQPNGAFSGTIDLTGVPAGAVPISIKLKPSVSFTGGAVTFAQLTIEDFSNNFYVSTNLLLSPGDTVGTLGMISTQTINNQSSSTVFHALLDTGGDVIDSLTAGSVDIWVWYVIGLISDISEPPTSGGSSSETGLIKIGELIGVNLNTLTDQSITMISGTKFIVTDIVFTNASTDLSATTIDDAEVWTGAGRTGVQINNTTINLILLTTVNKYLNATSSSNYIVGGTDTVTTTIFSLGTVAGLAATADIRVYGYKIA